MLLGRNVHKLEVKEKNRRDPAVDSVVGMESRVIDHPLNELGIHLDDELLNSDRIKLSMLQGAEDTGGKGSITQWVHGEFIVISEAICSHFTHQAHGKHF